jgi:hypothetical protein
MLPPRKFPIPPGHDAKRWIGELTDRYSVQEGRIRVEKISFYDTFHRDSSQRNRRFGAGFYLRSSGWRTEKTAGTDRKCQGPWKACRHIFPEDAISHPEPGKKTRGSIGP